VGADELVTGAQLAACEPADLPGLIARGRVFAQVTPLQKAQVVRELRRSGRVTGFLGDGVNDAAALRAADASLSLRSAAPLARECSDVVLGAGDLAALAPAVVASRRAVVNAVKYLKITISANAGNTLSMLLAVLLLPFLPMLPLQVLVQNLGFDLCQLALAGDRADPGAAAAPRGLVLRELVWFTAVFGLLGTAADLAAFAALGLGHAAPATQAAFQAGWFAENLLTQALAIHLLRADRTTRAGRGSAALAAGAGLLALTGLLLPRLGPAASALGFAAPAAVFYPRLALIAAGYCALAVAAKVLFRGRLGLAS
jgi:Mg2+-importing ATPase